MEANLNAEQVIKLLVLLTQLSGQIQPLIDSIKAAFDGQVTEAELQAELAKLRAQNDASYDAAVAALQGIINKA